MGLHVLPPLARVSGTHVWVPRPEGFIDSPHFPGFGDPESGALVGVTELPDPYPAVAESLSPEQLTAQGLRVHSVEAWAAGAHTGMLLHVEQERGGIRYDKWMGVLGDARRSVMVVGSCRIEHAPALSSLLRSLVTAARWEADAEEAPEAAPFVVGEPAGFLPAYRVQHSVLYTEDGQVPGPGSDAATLLVGPLPVHGKARDLRDLSAIVVTRMQGVEELELEAEEQVLVAGMRAHEMVVLGRAAGTGEALVLYQLLLAGPDCLVMVQGRMRASAREALLPRMQRAARSVRAA